MRERLLEYGLTDDQDGYMNVLLSELVLYLRLAQAFKNRLLMADRDRALLLAGVRATRLGMPAVAEFCRRLILQHNPGHMVRRWDSVERALQDDDFLHLLRQVQRKLPIERAESMLVELGDSCDVRPTDYPDDLGFVAAVMGVDAEWLTEHFQ